VRWPSAFLSTNFVLDFSMNRIVGPLLLLGLGLCAASGCALPGADRMSGLAQRKPWSDEKPSRSKATGKDPESQGIVSFRRPTRAADSTELSSTTPGELTTSPLLAGHSSDRSADRPQVSLPKPRSAGASLARNDSIVTLDGHIQEESSSDSPARDIVPVTAQSIEPLPDERVGPLEVTTANYRSDRNAIDNPIQLQGFEPIVPLASAATTANPNEPPLWEHRPAAKSASPAAGQVSISSQPMGRVQPVSTQAALVVPPGPWQADFERLIARAEREVAELKPGSTLEVQAEYRRRQVHLRLLYLMAQRQEQALTAIPGLEPAEQEYWQQLCWAASNSLDAEQFPSPRERAAQSISPLNTALRRLREQSDLAIKNIAFCEQISYFGNYQKFARDEFTPGQEVLLYAEIENFNTAQTPDGEHRTLLRSVIDIVGSNGETRWHKTFPATEDRCRNPRRDYFHNYQFAIPDRLPLGPHTLKLTVVDDLSGKQASYSLNFLVK
jgi:hypothetical protein